MAEETKTIVSSPKDYWISPNALSISLNALGDHDRIQASVASGAVIFCYIKDIAAFDFDAGHNFRKWPLVISPTYFNSTTEKYLYVAIPRSNTIGSEAMIVFPSQLLDIYGRAAVKRIVRDEQGNMLDPDGNITTDESKADYYYIAGDQIGSEDYYYIWLHGIITASGDNSANERDWATDPKYDTGRLNTDETWGEVVTLEDLMIALRAKVNTEWFSRLFILHGYKMSVVYKTDPETGEPLIDEETGEPIVDIDEETGLPKTVKEDVVIQPNAWPQDGDGITITDIESKYGLWTNFFLSALGKNDAGGGGGGADLFEPLLSINASGLLAPTPAQNGMTVVYNSATQKWEYGIAGGGGASLNEPLAGINSAALGLPPQGLTDKVGIVWNYTTQRYEWGETGGGGSGSDISIGLTMPTGFAVSPTVPITSSGTFAVSFAEGYSLPTTAKQGQWDDAYNKRHEHSNKNVLDGITSEKVIAWDGVAAIMASPDSDTIINKWQEVVDFLDTYTEADTLAGLLSNKLDVSVANSDFLKKTDAANTYVTKTYFDSLFELWNDNTDPSSKIAVNTDISSFTAAQKAKLNIKAMFGFWTEQYISALGKNDDGGSGGGDLDPDAMWELLTTYDGDASHIINSHYLNLSNYALANHNHDGIYSPTGHNHDSVYAKINTVYTKGETDTLLANKLDVAFFDALFKAYAGDSIVSPNTSTTSVDNIKAMFGFWTEQYISALGKNDDGGGGGGTDLSEPLLSINESGLGLPPQGLAGKVGIVWNYATQSYEWGETGGGGSGSVTSIGLTMPTGFAVNPAVPITGSGTFAVTFADGYSLPTTVKQGLWDEAYNLRHTHSNKGVLDGISATDITNWNNKVDKVTGKGLSTNDFTDALLSKLNGIETGANKYIHPTDGANSTITAADRNVLSAITVDNLGHVTSVSSKTLAIADMPDLSGTYVTLSTNQTISGVKTFTPLQTFTNGIKIGTYEIVPDPQNGGLHIKGGLYADTYVSALGLSNSGSGSATALSDLVDVSVSGASNGQGLVYDNGLWKNKTLFTDLSYSNNTLSMTVSGVTKSVTVQSSGGTVTSVATGTGLTGGPITSSGTISINSTYQTYISHGEAAYNSLSNYLPLSGGMMTGQIQRNSGGVWAAGNSSAIIKNTSPSGTDSYNTAFSCNTQHGDWSMGTHGTDDALYAVYNPTGNTAYANVIRVIFPTANCTLLGTNNTYVSGGKGYINGTEITSISGYLPLTGGTLTGGLTVGGTQHQNLIVSSSAVTSNVAWTGIQINHVTNGSNVFYGGLRMNEQDGSFFRYDHTYTQYRIWDSGNDGSGSGLDADLLDGHDSSYFATSASLDNYVTINTQQTITGMKTFTNIVTLTGTYFVMWDAVGGHDFTMYWTGVNQNDPKDIFTLYSYENAYYDMCLGTHPNAVGYGGLFFDASAYRWGVGTLTPAVKFDIVGNARVTDKLYLYKDASDSTKDVYLEYVSANGGIHLAGGGLYADTYISALGLNDTGGAAFDEDAMWRALGTTISAKNIALTYIQSAADTRYAKKTDIPTLSTLSWSYGSVTSASGSSYNGSAARSLVIPKATSHLTNDSGFIMSSSLGSYLPLSAGSSKPLTGSLYLNGRGMGIFMPYTVSGSAVNIPLIYDNGANIWLGAMATEATHHIGRTYISAGHDGTSGNDTIYVCVPNAANTNGTNYGVLHAGNYSTTLDTRYVTISTAQRITGEKKFSYPYGMVMDRDTSNYKNISRVFASNGTTQIGYIGYINVTQRMFLSAQDNTDPWTDTVGKYQLRIGVNELTYNTYSILHAGNSSISGSTVTINGTSIDAVRYLYDASSEWKGTSGSFFFGGTNVLKSGYDYVGIQAGNNVDKWQIVGIDGLQWRQNDSGGTNTASWTDWRMLIDSSNYRDYTKPRYLLSRKSLSSAGWYRVADVKQYGMSFLLTICGNYNNSGPATPVTYLVSHSYTTDDIRQIGGCATIGHVNAVRVIRYASGCIYIDIYYSKNVANGIGVEITPLDEKSSWLSTSIDMIDFESVSSSVPSGQTLVDTKYVNKTGLEGIYTMNGGQQGPGYFGKSAVGFLMSNQAINGDSSYKNWIYMDNYFGDDVGGTTAIGVSRTTGRMFVMRSDANRTSWNTLREVVVADSDTGNVGIGKGNTAASYKLEVNGTAKVTSLRIGSIEIIEDSTNGGLRVVGGGLSADTYISALGVGEQGGSGTDLETVWASMREVVGSSSNHTIDVSHISAAMSSYLTSNSYATQTWVNNKNYATQAWVNQQGFVTSAGITSIALSVPTGLKVNSKNSDTLTSNGTFAITFTDGYSIPTTTKQSQWDTAYTNSHTHSNKTVLDGITSAKVSNWDSAYSTVNTIGGYFTDGSANTAVKLKTPRAINGTNFDGSAAITTTKWGTARNISIADADATNTGSAISVDGSSAVTLKLPSTIKASLSGNISGCTNIDGLLYFDTTNSRVGIGTSAPSYKLHVTGSVFGNSLHTNNNLSSVAGGSIEGFHSIELNSLGSLNGNYGGFIDFHYTGSSASADYTSRIIEDSVGGLTVMAKTTSGSDKEAGLRIGTTNGANYLQVGTTNTNSTNQSYVQIGNIRLVYEYSNNALKVQTSTGGAANFYALGGISALGINSNTSGEVSGNLLPSPTNSLTIGDSTHRWKSLYLGNTGITASIEALQGSSLQFSSSTDFNFNNDVEVAGDLYVNDHLGVGDNPNDSYALYVYGTSYMSAKLSIGGTNSNSDKLYVNGSARFNGVAYATSHQTSDMRMKDFIENTDIDVEAIARAPLFLFTWKDKSIDTLTHLGTSAQYWQGVAAETVTTDGVGTLGLDYGVTALASVISVARRVMTHEEEIADLKRRLSGVEKENEQLRNEIEMLKAA